MKVELILNGKSEHREIPMGWSQVDYETFLRIQGLTVEPLAILSVLWGVPVETLKRCTIVNFSVVAAHLNALAHPLDTKVPETVLGFPVPKDLNFDQVGRYWDIKAIYDSFFDGEGKYTPDLKRFPEVVTAAIMPQYVERETTVEMQQEFTAKLMKAPCEEVLAIANFYLAKLTLLRLHTAVSASQQPTQKKKLLPGLINWGRNLVLLVRLKYWSRKLRSTGTKS